MHFSSIIRTPVLSSRPPLSVHALLSLGFHRHLILGMPPEEACEHDMFVLIRWRSHELAVPLRQLEDIHVDEPTQQAIEDWHYWVNQGYQL